MTLFHGLGHVASGRLRSIPGMVLLKPTSIAHSGTSASIGANGQVTFTAVTSLSMNGVFSADYDNYLVAVRTTTSGGANVGFRLRLSGTDATGSNYVFQTLIADSTTTTASRSALTTSADIGSSNSSTEPHGISLSVYRPNLAQPTAFRSVTVNQLSGARLMDYAGTHSLSTAYDGFTLFLASNNLTGALQVYGVRS